MRREAREMLSTLIAARVKFWLLTMLRVVYEMGRLEESDAKESRRREEKATGG